MSNRIVAAIGAATLVVGILAGAAVMTVVRDVSPQGAPNRGMWGEMMPMMGRSMMSGVDLADMAELHAQHHGSER